MTNSYASNTELADGQHALLIDPGSVNNLTGGEWVRRGAGLAKAAGRTGSTTIQRKETLHVSGVGTQSQECHYNAQLPVALQDINGKPIEGTYLAPTINNSRLPALLGLSTLMQRGAIMDFRNMHLHFTGPGPVEYMQHLPEGTTTFNMLQAPSGHVMLPCCKYPAQQAQPQEDGSLTLHASSSTTQPTREISNPWNAFQHRYSKQGLTKEEFSAFYKWEPREDLERTQTETQIVQQFLAHYREDAVLIPADSSTQQ